jgi:hypothetical protein
MMTRVVAAALACAACGGPSVPAARFVNGPIARAVNDRVDVPQPPKQRVMYPSLYNWDGAIQRRLERGLELPRDERAHGVNALDDVPDSTWFTNRIGIRELTPDDIERGPVTDDSPELHTPWTVHSTKPGGASTGFMITDARGIKYLLKFDDKGTPELETGFDVIVDRLLWAVGYNVPEDHVVYFRDTDLVVAKDAIIKDVDGASMGSLDRAGLLKRLEVVDRGSDGRIRGLVSRWIAGKTVGGHPGEGVRTDDPNDRIPHELRRDLRGAYSVFAWLDHVDIQEGNFVDSWVADPADPKRHYLEHYFIDFGRSLGAMAYFQFDWRRGHMYLVDFTQIGWQLVTLGLAPRPWIGRPIDAKRAVGMFDAGTFDPGAWHPDWAAYLPLRTADRFDKFWGAKLVARFTRAQIAGAVAAGRLTDPKAAAYIVDTLIARQRATAAYWFARVNPLDGFTASPADDGAIELCFDDLAISSHVANPATTRYSTASWDWSAREVAGATATAATGSRTCARVRGAKLADDDGYTIVRVDTTRPGFNGTTFVHVGRDPATTAPRVIGVWRQ